MPRVPANAAPEGVVAEGVPVPTVGRPIDNLRVEYDAFYIRCTSTSMAQELVSASTCFLGIGTMLSLGLKVVSVHVLRSTSAAAARAELARADGGNVTEWTELEVCADAHWSTMVVQLLLMISVVCAANQELALALLGGLGPPIGRRVVGQAVSASAHDATETPQDAVDGGTVRFASHTDARPPDASPQQPPERPPGPMHDHNAHVWFLVHVASCPHLTHAKRGIALLLAFACTVWCTSIVSGPNDPDMGPAGCTLSSAVGGLASGTVLNVHRRVMVKVSADTALLYLSTAVHSLLYHTFLGCLCLLLFLLSANVATTLPRLYLRLALCAAVVYVLGWLYETLVPILANLQLAITAVWDVLLPCTLGRPPHLITRTIPLHDMHRLFLGLPSQTAAYDPLSPKSFEWQRLPRVSRATPEQAETTMHVLSATLSGLRVLSGLLVSAGFATGMRSL